MTSAKLAISNFKVQLIEVAIRTTKQSNSNYHEKTENDQIVEARNQNLYQLWQHQHAKQDAGK